jgi:transcriptional regulator with XRE-family HTH domain
MRAQDSARTGAAIRKLRLARGWTLAELNRETGVPLSTLSRLELGQNALKYEILMRICRALEVDLQGLVAREAETMSVASGRRSVTRSGEGRPARLGGNAGWLAGEELTERSLTPILLDVSAANLEAHGPLVTLPNEAHLLVLSGEIALHSQFYAPLILGEGDGLYFDARAGFAVVRNRPESARVLLTVAGHVEL